MIYSENLTKHLNVYTQDWKIYVRTPPIPHNLKTSKVTYFVTIFWIQSWTVSHLVWQHSPWHLWHWRRLTPGTQPTPRHGTHGRHGTHLAPIHHNRFKAFFLLRTLRLIDWISLYGQCSENHLKCITRWKGRDGVTITIFFQHTRDGHETGYL